AGARARHPGGSPSDDHGHVPPAMSHGHAAPSPTEPHAIAHASHGELEQHAPAAAGSRMAEVATPTLLFFAMVLSWVALYNAIRGRGDLRIPLMNWFTSGELKVDWALRIDTLATVMLVVVTSVSAFVHLYSIGYMNEDPHRPRFFSYLSLFT